VFELTVLLVVTLYSPDTPRGATIYTKEYPISEDAPELAIEACYADAAPYSRQAIHVGRGTWLLDVACQVRHDEAEPARDKK